MENNKKKKKWPVISAIAVLIAAFVLPLVRCGSDDPGAPTLTVETPQKRSASDKEEFSLDVTISDLGEAIYPAASFSIRFDPSRLEVLGVEEGDGFILDDENQLGQQLPDWSVNVQNSNDTGLISILYLDMTGGRYAFSRDLLAEENNVVLRLKFRLRGSV